MLSSLRLLPSQASATAMLTLSNLFLRSSMLNLHFPFSMSSSCVSHSRCGTGPWFRTQCKRFGVIRPVSKRSDSGYSAFKGCLPVRRIIFESLGIQLSGLARSASSITSEGLRCAQGDFIFPSLCLRFSTIFFSACRLLSSAISCTLYFSRSFSYPDFGLESFCSSESA